MAIVDPRKGDILRRLTDARERTYRLLRPVSDADSLKQHSPLMSPLVWDLGHIGNFEELWLVQELGEQPPMNAQYDDLYDAFRHPRRTRVELPIMDRFEAERYLDIVRSRAVENLAAASLDSADPLTRAGFVFEMVIQHEYQHNETMLATLQLMAAPGYRPEIPPFRKQEAPTDGMVFIDAGPFTLGTDDRSCAYDNERPAHEVDLPAFWIDVAPVTNGEYLRFIEDGGYSRAELWSNAGWTWLGEAQVSAPQFWSHQDGRWNVNTFGHETPMNPRQPVQHVCFHEAQAYARWAGKRLPTESEWEKAASWDPVAEYKRMYPWGDEQPSQDHANLDQLSFQPMEVGAYPEGVSAYGATR